MRLVHLSDLHLGFRAYFHLERGWNRRERDVASAFLAAVEQTARLQPDLVLITGDVFDGPNPPSTAFLTVHRALARLRRQLPDVPVLIIAGERDSPWSRADPGPVAVLDSLPGVEAAAGAPRSVHLQVLDAHALLVPFRAAAGPPLPEVCPDPSARWNLLLVRGRPSGSGNGIRVNPSEWNYVAVGGDHRPVAYRPNVRTAGAPERPGTCPWAEATEERGFLTFDLASGEAEFHPITGRPVVDLAPVRVTSEDPGAGTRRLREVLHGVPGGVEGKIVRARLRGEIIAPGDGLSQGLLDAVMRRAAHLEVHMEPPSSSDEPSPERAVWTPGTLSIPGIGSLRLAEPGVPWGTTLVTSERESWRARLVEALRGGARAWGDDVWLGEFRTDPDPPADPDLALDWAGDPDPAVQIDRYLRGGEGEAAGAGRVAAVAARTPAAAGEDAGALEAERIERRADWIEASGDLEAANLQWAQEQQEAESKLQVYRARAVELRQRIRELTEEEGEASCPTCGRTLGEGYRDLLGTLRSEWEEVVQDGLWWARRRQQLGEKSEELQRLEERALRLQAAAEEAAEALERARSADPGERPPDPAPADPLLSGVPVEEAGDRTGSDAGTRLQDLLRRAGGLLSRITEGRLVGLRSRNGFRVVGADGAARIPSGLEAVAARLALHLAIWLNRRSGDRTAGALLVHLFKGRADVGTPCFDDHRDPAPNGAPGRSTGHESGVEELLRGAMDLLSDREHFPVPILVVAPPTAAEHAPGAFFQVVELAATGEGCRQFRRMRLERPALSIGG